MQPFFGGFFDFSRFFCFAAGAAAQVTENAELSGTLDQGEDAIIERYAREQGYAKPNERVFVDISGK